MGFAYGPTPDAHLCRTTGAGMHSLLSYGAGGIGDSRNAVSHRRTAGSRGMKCAAGQGMAYLRHWRRLGQARAGKCGRKCGPSDGHETFPGWLILALCG